MKDYTQLSLSERCRLEAGLKKGLSIKEIAEQLNRHRSSLYRELKRSSIKANSYMGTRAQSIARKRRRQERSCKLEKEPVLQDYVLSRLKQGWSPEQIAGRLKRENKGFSLCHETIYRYIYRQSNKELYHYLTYKKPHRQKRFSRKPQGCRFGERHLITHRPVEVSTRKQLGHWEGDNIEFGLSKKTNITTLVERKSRVLLLLKNEVRQSEKVMENIRFKLSHFPQKYWSTITFDQGPEFANHLTFEHPTRCKVYYCQAHSPWQKGSNENMNGRLRRYLPRSTDLRKISQEQLEVIAKKMNNLPRKCLRFQTPKEILLQHTKIFCRTSM